MDPLTRTNFGSTTLSQESCFWAPPPAAADVALEELQKARIKRQESTQYFVCSRLLTSEWLKQLWKTADIILQVPPGSPSWPLDMFEPLMIGLIFPFLPQRHWQLWGRPWQVWGTPKTIHMVRQVRKMFKEEVLDAGVFLHKLILDCSRLYTMPADVVRQMLFFKSDGEFLCQLSKK
jgi:hypothetical protein